MAPWLPTKDTPSISYSTVHVHTYSLKFSHTVYLRIPWHSVPRYPSNRTRTTGIASCLERVLRMIALLYRIMCPMTPAEVSNYLKYVKKKSHSRARPQLLTVPKCYGALRHPKVGFFCHCIPLYRPRLRSPFLLMVPQKVKGPSRKIQYSRPGMLL